MDNACGDDDARCCSFCRRRWGWVVTIATFLMQFFGVGLVYSFGIVSIALQEEFEVGVTTTGWIPTVATGLNLILGVLTDEFIKKTSHRLVAYLGVFLCFGACVLTSFMPVFSPMIFTFGIVYGFGLAFSTMSGMVMIVEWFQGGSSARPTALAVAGTSTGMLVFNPIMYLLVTKVGWRNTLRIIGSAILVNGCAASATFSKPIRNSGQKTPPDENDRLENDVKTNVSSLGEYDKTKRSSVGYYDILRYPEFWTMFSGIVILSMTISVFLFYWVKLIVTSGYAESTAALSMTVLGASDLAGKLLLSAIVNYLPFPKMFLFTVASTCGIAMMFAVININSMASIFSSAVAIGMFVLSLLNASPFIAAAQVFPGRGAAPMTLSTIAMGTGLILGTVYGTSMDHTGSFVGTLYGCIGAYALAILLFSLVPLYQKIFAPERYVMWDNIKRLYRCQRDKTENLETKRDLNDTTL